MKTGGNAPPEKGRQSMTQFNSFRFDGLHCIDKSNKYLTMNRVSDDETKIVVKIDTGHLQKTKYGYALILDDKHVVFVKDWQVSNNYFGCEILLEKEYFNVKEWGYFEDYANNEQNLSWQRWKEAAEAQDALRDQDGLKLNPVMWQK